MRKKIGLLCAGLMVLSCASLVACGPTQPTQPTQGKDPSVPTQPQEQVPTNETAKAIYYAQKMTLAELEAKSKEEMAASKDTFKVVGLTSVLKKAMTTFAKKYDWIKYESADGKDNTYLKSDYKDYALLQALETAETQYFADFALVQDVRAIADYDEVLLHNFVPSDWKEMGLKEVDTKPLKGVHFNKLFWTNTNFEKVTGKKLYNIWQVAGSESDKDHLSKVSFQTAATEQINMSFLLSCEAEENQPRIEAAYEKFYGKKWSSTSFTSAGQQWVNEFINNISRWHSSDGTAMKETQLKDDWNAGYVYYGAFAKMKDAVGKKYDVDMDGDGTKEVGVNAMSTVKWNWEIEGFNGFMYTMCSQIVNNAKHPYTACLYARNLLTLDAYKGAVYNADMSRTWEGDWATDDQMNKPGTKCNQYGYYFPASNDIANAANDWDRDTHIAKEINENYSYLQTVKGSQVNRILGWIANNKKASA